MKAILKIATHRAHSDPHFSVQPVHSSYTMTVTCKETEAPVNRSVTGYGSRIPTRYMVHFQGRWRRVYCRIYSNVGTLYIGTLRESGERIIVDIESE